MRGVSRVTSTTKHLATAFRGPFVRRTARTTPPLCCLFAESRLKHLREWHRCLEARPHPHLQPRPAREQHDSRPPSSRPFRRNCGGALASQRGPSAFRIPPGSGDARRRGPQDASFGHRDRAGAGPQQSMAAGSVGLVEGDYPEAPRVFRR